MGSFTKTEPGSYDNASRFRAPATKGAGAVGMAEAEGAGRKVRQYHPELLNKAVQLVTEKGMSLSNAADVMGIPMTTLWRKVKAKDPSAVGGPGGGRGGGSGGRGRGRGHDPPPPTGMPPSSYPPGYLNFDL